tara:strand:- start:54 stop:881 length:828 start_codon:yes stop_codon:yes gene_type:complete
MSRTLKRPMFRKGGEVMEGIMTGIKPRKNYENGTPKPNADPFAGLQKQFNMIDQLAGVGQSPLSDPLTQFLLGTGQRLIGGEAAGGTKLQEIVGATKQPLEVAIKQQALKDAGRRKLAASLIGKTKTGDFLQKWNQVKGSDIYPDTAEGLQKFRNDYAKGLSFERKPKAAADIAAEEKSFRVKEYAKRFERNMEDVDPRVINEIVVQQDKLEKDPKYSQKIDSNKGYVEMSDVQTGQTIPVEDPDDYRNGYVYYNYLNNTWYTFDGEKLVAENIE